MFAMISVVAILILHLNTSTMPSKLSDSDSSAKIAASFHRMPTNIPKVLCATLIASGSGATQVRVKSVQCSVVLGGAVRCGAVGDVAG